MSSPCRSAGWLSGSVVTWVLPHWSLIRYCGSSFVVRGAGLVESLLCSSVLGSRRCSRVVGRVGFVFVARLVVVLVVRRGCGLRVLREIRGCLSDMRSMVRWRVGRVCFVLCRYK